MLELGGVRTTKGRHGEGGYCIANSIVGVNLPHPVKLIYIFQVFVAGKL